MNRRTVFILLTVFFSAYFSSCKKFVDEELSAEAIACSVDTVSYSRHVVPFINGNCMPCHSSSQQDGNVALDTYNDVSGYADAGALSGVMRHQSGFSAMPMNRPKVSDCYIRMIDVWVEQGYPNN